MAPKMTKKQNLKIIKDFMHFLLEFQQTSWIRMLKSVNKGKSWLFNSLF